MKNVKIILLAAVILISSAFITGCGSKNGGKANTPTGSDGGKKYTCSLEIRCDTILKNMDKLAEGKKELIPENGQILYIEKAEFTDGESVFDMLQRELKNNKIHFEFEQSKVYKSAYIEGIDNIYELDCGELSGWEFSVNGDFPSYGSALYKLQDGDQVKVLYTCDLGTDIGNDKGKSVE